MGSQSSKVIFDVDDWQEGEELRFSSVIRHRRTHEELERYTLVRGQLPNQRDRELYTLRRNNKNGWVPVLYHFWPAFTGLCGGKSGYFVVTERFERLSELKRRFSEEEGLSLLAEALHNYGSLVSQFGYFNITAGMMVLDRRGELRVWFNENFSSNSKTIADDQKLDCKSLILSILKVIADRTEGGCIGRVFEGRERLNFVEAYEIVAKAKQSRRRLKSKAVIPANDTKYKENKFLTMCHANQSNRKDTSKRTLNRTDNAVNKSMVVLPSKELLAETADWNTRKASPRIEFPSSPQHNFRRKAEISEESLGLSKDLQLKLESILHKQTGSHKRTLATVCSSPDAKIATLPTSDTRIFQSMAYHDHENKRQPAEEIAKPTVCEASCQTTQPEQTVHRPSIALRPEQPSSKKSMSMWLPNRRDPSRRLYDDIQRIDSVLMLGASGSSESEPSNVVVIESTILRS